LVDNNRDGIFGTNTEWDVKDVRRYITRLEKFGATDIKVKDFQTISFKMPADVNRDNILLFILTYHPLPTISYYNGRTDRLTLSWDY
jgi:hypothetical protein